MTIRRMKLFIIIINLLYVTANKPTVYDQLFENLLKYLNIEGEKLVAVLLLLIFLYLLRHFLMLLLLEFL